MKQLKLIALLMLVSLSVIGQNKNAKTEALFTQYLQEEDPAIGKKIIDAKDNLYSLYCQGMVVEDTIKKLALFTRFIQSKPALGLAAAYLKKGSIYASMGQPDSAMSNFNKSIALDDKNIYGYFFRGDQWMKMEENDKAIDDFTKAITISNNFYLAYHMRGICLMNQKKYKNALTDFNKTFALDKSFYPALLMRAMVYEETGEYQKAIDDWNQSLKINKDNAQDVKEHIKEATKKMKEKKK
jgi:tetratricopeptide (TPR) repeat protein